MENIQDPRPQGLAQTQQHSASYVMIGLAQGFTLTLSLFLLLLLGI